VKLVRQLELEVDVVNVDELSESHGAESTNEDPMELEAGKGAEQIEAEAEDEPFEEPQCFNTKGRAVAFHEICIGNGVVGIL
jgi:hypothetical protein